ncbi:MAG: hypothetical protein WCS94_12855 [Verrucomicrobiota bacterium]
MPTMTHHRFQHWHWVLTTVLLLTNPGSNLHAQAVEASVARAEKPSDCFPLDSHTNDLVMMDFASTEALQHLVTPKEFRVNHRDECAEVSGPMAGRSQSLAITSGAQPWDLSHYLYLVADVHNGGTQAITIICRAEDPEYAGWHHFAESVARIGAGETTSVLVFLKRKNPPAASLLKLIPGMNTLPDGYMPHWSGLDPARVSKIVLGLETSETNLHLALRRLRGVGICDTNRLLAADFFPFIDSFGQFRHAEWPTKIHSPKDFAAQQMQEATALQSRPRPTSWDKYGGYQDGPQLVASGHFRVAKHAGKWWLVDPDGHLFWSHGVTGVGVSSSTPVQGRQKFFAELPALNQESANSVNWYLANLKLKYGLSAENTAATLAHKRLASWGLNTLASWSDPKVTALDKTPYTKMLEFGGPRLAPGLKLSDPFDLAFRSNARRALAGEKNSTGNDPWCIGYFIGNELEWRNGPDLINEVLMAPAKQPGKQALISLLKHRHATVAELNAAWHTTYASWDHLLRSTNKVDATLALPDFTAFNEELAEHYYQICQAELKLAMPNKLNLGSRFHTVNPIAVRAAARYCDVVSFNKYNTSIRNLNLPDGLDRPIIIGEFHFPAWDRSFAANAGCGRLCEVQRADCYWYYLTGALDNPLIVGTHWFQYLDQPLTGRTDGENFPIGFVDVTDTPYNELTKVTRELGDHLYARRLSASPTKRE